MVVVNVVTATDTITKRFTTSVTSGTIWMVLDLRKKSSLFRRTNTAMLVTAKLATDVNTNTKQ